MNQNPILPDDPRLTAYAFDEMNEAERAQFEQQLAADPAARQAVEAIRAAGALLASALEHEPAPPVTQLHDQREKPARNLVRFPQFYYVVSGLAAACFAVFFVHWQQNQVVVEKKGYRELELGALSAAEEAEQRQQTERKAGAEQPAAPAPVVSLDAMDKAQSLLAHSQPAELMEMQPKVADGYISSDGRSLKARSLAPAAVTVGGIKTSWNAGSAFHTRSIRETSTEAYGHRKDSDYQRVADHPLSTFAVDVDTAAYANVRRFLAQGQRPPVDAVRIEELVNYFPYHYSPPVGPAPFAAHLEVASAPWAPGHRLVRIGLKGREVTDAARPAANLVFLIDVSGSMQGPTRLPLVKQSLRLLVNKLRPDDRVAIAVYAGASGLALPSTPVSRKADILAAIDQLDAGGSTNGAMGIHLAYDIAKANFLAGGVNRVILATDGDFNVGTTSEGELVRLVEEKARSGVFLSVLGYGMGNLKDSTLEQLADKGNGNYAYIDSLAEARKALVEQAGGTLVTIAKDVKIQVEFNPAQVAAYRLIGYENRLLAKEDFNNDAVDAGEIGAGHTVTALYEVVPAGTETATPVPAVDALKYQRVASPSDRGEGARAPGLADEMLTVKIRYKEPAGEVSSKLEFALRDAGTGFEQASDDFKFAAAVAGFGMALRDSPHKGSLTLAEVSTWGRSGLGSDASGYRSEFLGLIQQAEKLTQ